MMLSGRIRVLGLLLTLIALLCIGVSQAAALTADHSEDHGTHCCPVCHLGHSLVVSETQTVSVPGPFAPVQEAVREERFAPIRDCAAASTSPRAPPAGRL